MQENFVFPHSQSLLNKMSRKILQLDDTGDGDELYYEIAVPLAHKLEKLHAPYDSAHTLACRHVCGAIHQYLTTSDCWKRRSSDFFRVLAFVLVEIITEKNVEVSTNATMHLRNITLNGWFTEIKNLESKAFYASHPPMQDTGGIDTDITNDEDWTSLPALSPYFRQKGGNMIDRKDLTRGDR